MCHLTSRRLLLSNGLEARLIMHHVLQHFYPTIYAVTDIAPLAICTGELFPDGNPPPEGERTYCNNATIKACLPHGIGAHPNPK